MTQTIDKGVRVRDRMYMTVQQLGRSRKVLPNGTLLCQDVPIARTGEQSYTDGEVPIEGVGGRVIVDRPEEEVFRADTIASFEAVPITIEHPGDFVTPENYRDLAVGHVQNARRGEGIYDDLLIADLVITDPKAIEYVNKVRPELSAGYEADYEQVERGRGVQRNIVGNHVALVERGRAGPRVAIQDSLEGNSMLQKPQRFWDRLLTAVKAKDAAAVKAELEEEGEEERSKSLDSRMADAEGKIDKVIDMLGALDKSMNDRKSKDTEEEEAKKKTEEEEAKKKTEEEKTKDTILEAEKAAKVSQGKTWTGSLTGDALREISSRAETLVPGFKVPTGDAATASDAGERMMRHSLEKAFATDDGRKAIEPFLLGRAVSALTGDALQGVFVGAAALRERELSAVLGAASASRRSTKDFGGAPKTPAEINAANREYYEKRKQQNR